MSCIVWLPWSELKVIWDIQGSGAAGLCMHLFVCVLSVWCWEGVWGEQEGDRGRVNSLQKSNQGKCRAAGLFWIAQGPTIYRHEYKQRAGTANPHKCKIKKKMKWLQDDLWLQREVEFDGKSIWQGYLEMGEGNHCREEQRGHGRSNC